MKIQNFPKTVMRMVSCLVLAAFVSTSIIPPAYAQAMPWMPEPGTMVMMSPAFVPAQLKGMVIDPNEPFRMDFIMDRGDAILSDVQKQEEYQKLIKYFLAALAVPDTEQWVNLSPYERDRIIPDSFGVTEMGRDLLAQDYLLKQIASSLSNPDEALGKTFWTSVYAKAQETFGMTDIPASTINKVWIVPDKADMYEKDNTVVIVDSHLKVMLEEDYLATQQSAITDPSSVPQADEMGQITSRIMREIIIPAIEKEVNEGQNFAPLRQVVSGMILATWYKMRLKESILGKVYADKAKVKGIDLDPSVNKDIFNKYVDAFQKGVFNMIKEDVDFLTQEIIPRKYFSGGFYNPAMKIMEFRNNMPSGFLNSAWEVIRTLLRSSSEIQRAELSDEEAQEVLGSLGQGIVLANVMDTDLREGLVRLAEFLSEQGWLAAAQELQVNGFARDGKVGDRKTTVLEALARDISWGKVNALSDAFDRLLKSSNAFSPTVVSSLNEAAKNFPVVTDYTQGSPYTAADAFLKAASDLYAESAMTAEAVPEWARKQPEISINVLAKMAQMGLTGSRKDVVGQGQDLNALRELILQGNVSAIVNAMWNMPGDIAEKRSVITEALSQAVSVRETEDDRPAFVVFASRLLGQQKKHYEVVYDLRKLAAFMRPLFVADFLQKTRGVIEDGNYSDGHGEESRWAQAQGPEKIKENRRKQVVQAIKEFLEVQGWPKDEGKDDSRAVITVKEELARNIMQDVGILESNKGGEIRIAKRTDHEFTAEEREAFIKESIKEMKGLSLQESVFHGADIPKVLEGLRDRKVEDHLNAKFKSLSRELLDDYKSGLIAALKVRLELREKDVSRMTDEEKKVHGKETWQDKVFVLEMVERPALFGSRKVAESAMRSLWQPTVSWFAANPAAAEVMLRALSNEPKVIYSFNGPGAVRENTIRVMEEKILRMMKDQPGDGKDEAVKEFLAQNVWIDLIPLEGVVARALDFIGRSTQRTYSVTIKMVQLFSDAAPVLAHEFVDSRKKAGDNAAVIAEGNMMNADRHDISRGLAMQRPRGERAALFADIGWAVREFLSSRLGEMGVLGEKLVEDVIGQLERLDGPAGETRFGVRADFEMSPQEMQEIAQQASDDIVRSSGMIKNTRLSSGEDLDYVVRREKRSLVMRYLYQRSQNPETKIRELTRESKEKLIEVISDRLVFKEEKRSESWNNQDSTKNGAFYDFSVTVKKGSAATADGAAVKVADPKTGGIDLNAANLDMQIRRDGNGIVLPIDQQDLENIRIDGLVPVILQIQPASTLPLFSSLASGAGGGSA